MPKKHHRSAVTFQYHIANRQYSLNIVKGSWQKKNLASDDMYWQLKFAVSNFS